MEKMGRFTNGKRFKRLLAIVLSVLMLTSVIDLNGLVNVQASEIENPEAQVSDGQGPITYYDTIEEAIAAVEDGGIVTLLKDVQTESCIYIDYGKFVIDLKGKTWHSICKDEPAIWIVDNTIDQQKITIGDSTGGGRITSAGNIALKISDYSFVYLMGGSYSSIECLHMASTLRSGYILINNSDGSIVSDLNRGVFYDVSVKRDSVQIMTQPNQIANEAYGYLISPMVQLTAEKTKYASSNSTISYKWYREKHGEELSDVAVGTNADTLEIPTGLSAGTYSFYCLVSCEGYTIKSQSTSFTVEKSDVQGITVSGNSFIYRGAINVKDTGTIVGDIPADMDVFFQCKFKEDEWNEGSLENWISAENSSFQIDEARSYTMRFKFCGENYNDYITDEITCDVNPKDISGSDMLIDELNEIIDQTFTGQEITMEPVIKNNDSTHHFFDLLVKNRDYQISYRNNTNAGTATLIITGMGNYTGTVERNFEINKAPTPNIIFPESSPVTFGDKLSESQLISYGSGKYGTFEWSNPDEIPTVSNNGYEVTFTPNAITELNYDGMEIIKQKIPLVVQKAESTVALKHKISAETSQDQLSRMVTLTATVQGKEGANSPTGKVQFWSGSEDLELIGEANIQNQVATFEWSVPIGQWFDVTAKYVGDDNYNEFESSTIKGYSQQIGQLEQVDVSTSQFVENGMVDRNTLVSLSTQMKGATIYYTTDGTTPNQKSSVYKSPIRLTKDTTIQAIVYKKGYQSSAVVSCDYKIKTYTISFDAMTDSPFRQDYTLYKGDYVDLSTLIKPVMEDYRFLGWYKGDVLFDPLQPISQNEYYEAWWTQADTLNAPGSNYAHNQDLLEGSIVRLYAQEQDSIIYYTLDGSVPTKDSMIYHQGIVLNKTLEGDQAITIKAIATKEGYCDSPVATFTYMLREDKTVFGDILPQDFPYWEVPSELWIAGLNQLFVYTGTTIKPTVRVYDGKRLLKMYRDYTIAYRDNKEAGRAKVIIKFKGNYRGIRTYEYTIRPKPLTHDDVIASNPMVHATGKIQKCLPVVSDHGRKLAYHKDGKKDYVVTYQSASQDASTIEAQNLFKAPGKYKITITGTKNYTGSIDVVETILDKQTQFMISKASVASIPKQTYTGNKITPELTVKYGKKKLTVNEDYTLRYANNTAVGTGTILIQGIGDYHGAKLVTFKIQGKDMRYVKVTDGWVSEYEYDPSSSTYEQEELILGYQKSSKAPIEEVSSKAYTIRYLKNQGVGTATAIFTGRPEFGFSGSFKKTFKIKPNTNFVNADIIFPEDVPYQKAGCYPKISVSLNDVTLVEGRDYSVKYANHKAVCLDLSSPKAPTITIQGKGNYKGSKQVKFKIHKASLEDMTMHAQDREYTGKENAFSTKVTICDQNGKILVPGKDYNKNLTYRINETVLTKTDVVADGDIIIVSATGINGYEGVLETTFKVIRKQQFIGSAKVSIPDQTYTGEYIKIQKKDITISVQKGKETILLTPNDYEIIGYTNNLSKGTATITLKGVGAYGGIKKVSFKIISKEIIQPERF